MDGKKSIGDIRALDDGSLDAVTGGVGGNRPKYVSSFFCEQSGRTIRRNGVYTLERAKKLHDEKEHRYKKL